MAILWFGKFYTYHVDIQSGRPRILEADFTLDTLWRAAYISLWRVP